MFGQGRDGAEGLSTLVTFDLHPTICVHSLVSTEVRKLGVGFEAHFAPERFDGAVDVRVLLQSARSRESFPALWTRVTPCPHVTGPDVSLEVAGIREHFVTILAGEPSKLSVNHLVSEKVGSPGKPFIAMFANIFICLISVILNHVLVKSKTKKNISFSFYEKIFLLLDVKLTYKRQEKIYRIQDI